MNSYLDTLYIPIKSTEKEKAQFIKWHSRRQKLLLHIRFTSIALYLIVTVCTYSNMLGFSSVYSYIESGSLSRITVNESALVSIIQSILYLITLYMFTKLVESIFYIFNSSSKYIPKYIRIDIHKELGLMTLILIENRQAVCSQTIPLTKVHDYLCKATNSVSICDSQYEIELANLPWRYVPRTQKEIKILGVAGIIRIVNELLASNVSTENNF